VAGHRIQRLRDIFMNASMRPGINARRNAPTPKNTETGNAFKITSNASPITSKERYRLVKVLVSHHSKNWSTIPLRLVRE